MSLLSIQGASFSYVKDSESIFQDIAFEVDQGQVFCLLGPNGCGKTTLLDCILGLNRLRQGRIMIQGKDLSKFPSGQIARHVAYVPQHHQGTFPYTVLEMVKMGRAAYTGRFSSPAAEDKRIAKEALAKVGFSHLRHRPFTQLSGGESQLVLVARALAQKTTIIIMDEPTAHLDFRHEMVVMETIVDLVKTEDVSVIMATHFPNHVFYFENQGTPVTCALMHNKGFLALGQAGQVLSEANMQTLYGVNTRLVNLPWDNHRQLKHLIPVSTMGMEE
ncbi:MAG TPA: ABC transporter ATP-binding protein [Syntrophomonadaceae bacterium]|nr:ABC transporter ATP-binding protein [Syntrophomonadaceae bacterium]